MWDPDTRRKTSLPVWLSESDNEAFNDNGQVGGECTPGSGAACIWDKQSGVRQLGVVPGATKSQVEAISNRGQAVGSYRPADTTWIHAFVWDPFIGMTDLGVPSGHRGSRALEINERGDVLGVALDSRSGIEEEHNLVLWRKTDL